TNPGTDPGANPSPKPDQKFCALYPDASACAPLGSANDVDVKRDSKSVSLSPISIGLTNGVCPQPLEVEVFGAPLKFDYSAVCELASKLRPLVLLLGALVAGLIFVTGLMA
ncbi:virulence factor TspB C-terminal domain-related protein, partial [Burkholderia thailandensis]